MEGFFFSFLFAFLFLIMDDPCLFWPACALTPSWISHKDYWISLNEQRSEFTHLHPASTNHLLQRPPLLLRWISHYYYTEKSKTLVSSLRLRLVTFSLQLNTSVTALAMSPYDILMEITNKQYNNRQITRLILTKQYTYRFI